MRSAIPSIRPRGASSPSTAFPARDTLRESRLAVKVLRSIGVPVTYITDAEIWEFMPRADLIIMGADSIAWDGSVANKMGTALVSQLALACKKPVYIASELYKVNPS